MDSDLKVPGSIKAYYDLIALDMYTYRGLINRHPFPRIRWLDIKLKRGEDRL